MGLFSRTSRPQHEMLDSVIGPTADLAGTLRSDGGLRIEGQFEGLIEVAGNVVVTEGARVVADITARNVTVGGLVKGNVAGTGRLEILSTGQVIGDITVASVMIDEGGLFQGVSRMRGYEQRALQAPPDSPANGTVSVYVEEPPSAVETVDLKARPAPAAPSAAATGPALELEPEPEPAAKAPRPGPSASPNASPNPSATTRAAPAPASAKAPVSEPEIDFDDIEPVIPDIVIEEPVPASKAAPTPASRRGRR